MTEKKVETIMEFRVWSLKHYQRLGLDLRDAKKGNGGVWWIWVQGLGFRV